MFSLKKLLGRKEKNNHAENPKDGDITVKSFGSLGRDKLRQDILKHQGLSKDPSPTPAGLAIKQKKEFEEKSAKQARDKISRQTISPQRLVAMEIAAHSVEANTSQFDHIPLSPVMKLEEDQKFIEEQTNSETSATVVNSPSLDADRIYLMTESFEIPSEEEMSKVDKFPHALSLSDNNFLNNKQPSYEMPAFTFLDDDLPKLAQEDSNTLLEKTITEDQERAIVTSTDTQNLDIGFTSKDVEFSQELATAYSEQNGLFVIDSLRNYLNTNNGKVPKKFWYMLMDCYQVDNNKEEFEKVAISFAHIFNTSPPSWFDNSDNMKRTSMSGKNILILEPHFKLIHTEKFSNFLKAAKEEQFCRINISPCKFEISELEAIKKLLELFQLLRKNRVLSILMGDNNLIAFCQVYIELNITNKMLKDDFIKEAKVFWLLYLEILQWKGHQKEFEELAVEFAVKFEISPPDWDSNGVMRLDKYQKNETTEESESLDKIINSNNVDNLLHIIEKQFKTSNKAEVNLSSIESIDFAAAGTISYKIQELWLDAKNMGKKVIFLYPNEMIVTLLEMVGLSEFIEITHRQR